MEGLEHVYSSAKALHSYSFKEGTLSRVEVSLVIILSEMKGRGASSADGAVLLRKRGCSVLFDRT